MQDPGHSLGSVGINATPPVYHVQSILQQSLIVKKRRLFLKGQNNLPQTDLIADYVMITPVA